MAVEIFSPIETSNINESFSDTKSEKSVTYYNQKGEIVTNEEQINEFENALEMPANTSLGIIDIAKQ